MRISVLGYTGFIGENLLNKFSANHSLNLINLRDVGIENIEFDTEVVINLIGKAHDLKNISDPNEYYEINTNLSNKIFDKFLKSNAHTYIYISSIKAVSDGSQLEITDDTIPDPKTHYGISKLLSEKYIFQNEFPVSKRVFILRPTLIHGPLNKGNLNLLYKYVNKKIPWILGSFENKRSFCYIENLLFIIEELIANNNIKSDIFNISDDIPLSTNDVIKIISDVSGLNSKIYNVSKSIILLIAKIGDYFPIYLNSEKLEKLTQNFIVSNKKIISVINKRLPYSTSEGLYLTFKSFNK